MRIYDITVPIAEGMPVWPGDPLVQVATLKDSPTPNSSHVSLLSLSTHTGTHVDPPMHFIRGGATVDTLPLDVLVGPCLVRALAPEDLGITAAHLEALDLPPGTRRLLLKTRNSAFWAEQPHCFREDFVALTGDAARWLVERGIRLVGIDYLSVELFHKSAPVVHTTLLAAGVIALEGVDLSRVAPGAYTLVCLPLKIAGGDGSPARAILMQEED